ncbi:MAG: beta-N-acetylhexosaminidase, partial [Sulfobacillus sp.]|nr:beta-N-acetylhexosaminidase [Sulfobacillus sp.]
MMHETEQWRFWAGQVLMAGFDGTEPNQAIRDLIQSHHVGNIILFSRNVANARQLRSLTAGLQELAREAGQPWPLLIATDQENGMVRRLPPDIPGLPGNMALAATGDPALVQEVGMVTGQLLRAVGINMDLAPVLDVNNNPDNPVIGVRSYGDRADRVARFGAAMIRGLEAGGVLACGKHFPGHGDTVVDSHRALPEIPHDWERLRQVELPPFIHAMQNGLDAVMTAHIVFRAVDSRPATLSEPILTGWLRKSFGFNGVILTDCLEMDAIQKTVGAAQGAVDALKAGADIVLVSHSRQQQLAALNAIVAAVASGELPQSRLQDAARRVQTMKSRRLGDWNRYRASLEP